MGSARGHRAADHCVTDGGKRLTTCDSPLLLDQVTTASPSPATSTRTDDAHHSDSDSDRHNGDQESTASAKNRKCPTCARKLCLCRHLLGTLHDQPKLQNCKVFVLQHVREGQRAAISSVPVLSACLREGDVEVLKTTPPKAVEVLKTTPPKEGCSFPPLENSWVPRVLGSDRTVLLWPGKDSEELEGAVAKMKDGSESKINLLALDGTWGQARQLFNALSRCYPGRMARVKRVHLNTDRRKSLYDGIRREPKLGFLSTLEAVALCLGVLERGTGTTVGRAGDFLLDVFGRVTAEMRAFSGRGSGSQQLKHVGSALEHRTRSGSRGAPPSEVAAAEERPHGPSDGPRGKRTTTAAAEKSAPDSEKASAARAAAAAAELKRQAWLRKNTKLPPRRQFFALVRDARDSLTNEVRFVPYYPSETDRERVGPKDFGASASIECYGFRDCERFGTYAECKRFAEALSETRRRGDKVTVLPSKRVAMGEDSDVALRSHEENFQGLRAYLLADGVRMGML